MIQLSIQHHPIGKPNSGFNYQNWTQGWLPVALSPATLIAHIEMGKPFAVAQYVDNYRKSANFIVSDLIALDIDSGADAGTPLTEDEFAALLENPFIVSHAFAIIQSFSSQPNARKCRILFHLSESITDAQEYKALVTLLMEFVTLADPAAKDAARAFFGGQAGRTADFVKLDNTLDVAWLRTKLAERQAQQAAKTKAHPARSANISADNSYKQIREALSFIPSKLPYGDWLTILMAIQSAFPGADGIALAENWSPGKEGEVARKFASFTQNKVTLGTLFHHAQAHGYRFPHRPHHQSLFQPPVTGKIITVNERFITDAKLDLPKQGVILLKSPIGTGKTELMKSLLIEGLRVLVISHRVALTRDLANRFGENFTWYKENISAATLQCARCLVITPNSLHKLQAEESGQLPAYDIILIDEVEQVLEHLMGETFQGADGKFAYIKLVNLMQRSKLVIAADANASRISLEWLTSQSQKTLTLVHNTYQMQRGEMEVVINFPQMIELIEERLRTTQQPIAIACDQRGEVERQEMLLTSRGYTGLAIHQGNSQNKDIQHFIENRDQELPKLDYLIYSPTLNTGIDIQAEVDTIFGIFHNTTLTAPDLHQMLGRFRQAKRFVVYLNYVEGTRETNPATIKKGILDNIVTHARKFGFEYEFDENGFPVARLSALDDSFLSLYCALLGQRNDYLNNPYNAFLDMARDNYHLTFLRPPQEGDSNLEDELKAARKTLTEKQEQRVLTSPAVTKEDYDSTRNDAVMTPEIEAGYLRHVIEDFYGQPITAELLKEYKDAGPLRLIQFIHSYRSINDLVAIDRQEIEEGIPHHKRKLYAMKIAIIKRLLNAIFGETLHFDLFAKAVLEDKLTSFNQLYDKMKVNQVFNRSRHDSKDPWARFRWVLGQVGLKLAAHRHSNRKDTSYALDKKRFDIIRNLAEKRLKHIQDDVTLGTFHLQLMRYVPADKDKLPYLIDFTDATVPPIDKVERITTNNNRSTLSTEPESSLPDCQLDPLGTDNNRSTLSDIPQNASQVDKVEQITTNNNRSTLSEGAVYNVAAPDLSIFDNEYLPFSGRLFVLRGMRARTFKLLSATQPNWAEIDLLTEAYAERFCQYKGTLLPDDVVKPLVDSLAALTETHIAALRVQAIADFGLVGVEYDDLPWDALSDYRWRVDQRVAALIQLVKKQHR